MTLRPPHHSVLKSSTAGAQPITSPIKLIPVDGRELAEAMNERTALWSGVSIHAGYE